MKTSVYLDDADKRQLTALAAATGTSEAELLRRGLKLVLAQADRPRPRLGLAASIDGRTARDSDEALAATGFGVG